MKKLFLLLVSIFVSISTIAQVKVMNAFKVDTWSYARVDQVDDNQRYVAFLQEGDKVFLSIVNNTTGKTITGLITKVYDKKNGVTMMDLILDGKKTFVTYSDNAKQGVVVYILVLRDTNNTFLTFEGTENITSLLSEILSER